jgi:hypothetical protein
MHTFVDIPPSFDLRHNPMGPAIDKAEKYGGHVVLLDGKFEVVSEATLQYRNLDPLYTAGVGFTFDPAAA